MTFLSYTLKVAASVLNSVACFYAIKKYGEDEHLVGHWFYTREVSATELPIEMEITGIVAHKTVTKLTSEEFFDT